MTVDEPEQQPKGRKRGRPRLDALMVPQILDAAERLFAQREAANVSVRDIAAEAGVPHSAIYRYFDSKEDVLRQVLLRGRQRQIERDEMARSTEVPLLGALEWVMTENRAYSLALARAALEGHTSSSLGLDRSQTTAARALRTLEEAEYPFHVSTDHDPRMVVAALVAMSVGWAVAEDWIVDALSLESCDIQSIRQQVSEIMGSLMALGSNPRKECT
jgi:AcrR family transcriptional regulator